jgi:hypothetical protein
MVVRFATIYAINAYITNVSPCAIYTTLYDKYLSVTFGRSVVISGYSRILHQRKTDYQDITEILLRVALQKQTRGTAGRRSPALIHKWNNLTVRYVGLISPRLHHLN